MQRSILDTLRRNGVGWAMSSIGLATEAGLDPWSRSARESVRRAADRLCQEGHLTKGVVRHLNRELVVYWLADYEGGAVRHSIQIEIDIARLTAPGAPPRWLWDATAQYR